jgi:hypothetical protein
MSAIKRDQIVISREILERLVFEADEHIRRCNSGDFLDASTAPIYNEGDEIVQSVASAYNVLGEVDYWSRHLLK